MEVVRWAGLAEVSGPALVFVWLGMVLAISFLETPLKFRAPGITVPLGLGVGRVMFRALNTVEIALAALLVLSGLAGALPAVGWGLLAGLCVLLAVQVLALRPRLDRRVSQILAGGVPPRSHLHLAYIGLEVGKVLALPVLGVLLLRRARP